MAIFRLGRVAGIQRRLMVEIRVFQSIDVICVVRLSKKKMKASMNAQKRIERSSRQLRREGENRLRLF